jgi:hypothetical protein
MKPSVVEDLKFLRRRVGDGPAGKFLQRLLALALVKAGRAVRDEHAVEGPDLVVEGWQVEAKTTEAEPFCLDDKDLEDIAGVADGLRPVLALLELKSFDGWVVVDARGLRAKTLHKRDLALRRLRALERDADGHFDDVVGAWLSLIRDNPDVAFQKMDDCRKAGKWRL